MSNSVSEDSLIYPLVAAMTPMRVKVTMRVKKDRYYIHFDGSLTYKNASDWGFYWPNFEKYIAWTLYQNGFTPVSLKKKSPTQCVAYIGTLFDMLKGKQNDDDN
jgi:hypothetical protein